MGRSGECGGYALVFALGWVFSKKVRIRKNDFGSLGPEFRQDAANLANHVPFFIDARFQHGFDNSRATPDFAKAGFAGVAPSHEVKGLSFLKEMPVPAAFTCIDGPFISRKMKFDRESLVRRSFDPDAVTAAQPLQIRVVGQPCCKAIKRIHPNLIASSLNAARKA